MREGIPHVGIVCRAQVREISEAEYESYWLRRLIKIWSRSPTSLRHGKLYGLIFQNPFLMNDWEYNSDNVDISQ